jgi:hypothetical protein
MRKLLLFLIIIGVGYMLIKCDNTENMADVKPIVVSSSKVNYTYTSDNPQYIEFINGNDKYVMIDYRELPKDQIRTLITAVKANKLTTFEQNMCPANQSADTTQNIEACVDYILKTNTKHIPLFLMNKNDIMNDKQNIIIGQILGFNVEHSVKKYQSDEYNSLVAYNVPKSEVDFTNNIIKNINSNEVGVIYVDKDKNLIINTESRKEIKEIDMNNLTLNQIIPKIYYLTN